MKQNKSYGSVQECQDISFSFPPQHQDRQPGFEYVMNPRPISQRPKSNRKLENKVAIITGGLYKLSNTTVSFSSCSTTSLFTPMRFVISSIS